MILTTRILGLAAALIVAGMVAASVARAETAPGSLIGDSGTLVSATPLGANYLRCIKSTPQITNWACWFQYPAVIDRDYSIQ